MASRSEFHGSLSVALALARLAQVPCLPCLGESCAVCRERFMVDVGMYPTKESCVATCSNAKGQVKSSKAE